MVVVVVEEEDVVVISDMIWAEVYKDVATTVFQMYAMRFEVVGIIAP